MTKRKSPPRPNPKLAMLTYQLDALYLALGRSVLEVKEMQAATKKGAVEELRVTAFHLKERVQDVRRLQREILSELDKVGVLGQRAQGRSTGRGVRTSVAKRKPALRRR